MLEKLPEGVGHALINQRAGMEQVVYNHLRGVRQTARLEVRSSSFAFNAQLPAKYTADGGGISPPLAWDNCPSDAASVAIIVEDADSPTPHPLVHAIVVGIRPGETSIGEGALSKRHGRAAENATPDFEIGKNSYFEHAWLPPDPPPGHGEHRYVFQVFALRQGPALSKTAGRGDFIDAVLDRAVAAGCLIGTYERSAKETLETGVLSEKPSMA